jgi:hypothetical protein
VPTPTEKIDEASNSSTDMELDEPEGQDLGAYNKWEEGLEPRHRNILDVLRRISHRLVGHVVDCETAITDVIEDYFKDGALLLSEFDHKRVTQLQQHQASNLTSSPASAGRNSRMETFLRREQSKLRGDVRGHLAAWKRATDAKVEGLKKLEALATSK